MTFGQDWPTEELRDVLQEYGFRILGRERRRSGQAPWRQTPAGGRYSFDGQARWTETHYTLRRDLTCEGCGQPFGYNFEVDQFSQEHRLGRSTDGSLRQELGRQLRRRLRCPHCRTVQREPRRTLRRQGRKQVLMGCGLAAAGLLIIGLLALVGGLLLGIPGYILGLVAGLVLVFFLWFSVFPYVFVLGPSI